MSTGVHRGERLNSLIKISFKERVSEKSFTWESTVCEVLFSVLHHRPSEVATTVVPMDPDAANPDNV